VTGPEGEPRPIPHAVDQAAYRIIQEALTNAARHGAGQARIQLAFAASGLDLTVTNPLPLLILTTFKDDDYIFPSLRAGASGFLLKRARPDELIAAVHTVAAGDALLSPSVTRRVIDRMARQPAPEIPARATLDQLTTREKEVLRLVARGLSNKEIAAQLVVEDATVRSHIRRILMKLQLRDRIQIVIYAYEAQIIRPAPGAGPH
jgi:DNA-binding NarL/FixJ family response regulator